MQSWLIATFGIAIVGCGGNSGAAPSGGPAGCGSLGPCGGDIVGTWKILGACASGTTSSSACQAETVNVSSIQESGTITFNADLTYSVLLTQSTSETIDVPDTCLSTGVITLTCDQFGMLASNGLSNELPGGSAMVSCVTAGTSCQCAASLSVQNAAAMGTYSLDGSSVTTTTSTGGMGALQYCVSGTTLHLLPVGTNSTNGGTGTLVEDVVAMKQ